LKPVSSPYVVHHEDDEFFSLPPDELWREITDWTRFEEWWSWLHDLRVEPGTIASGSKLTFAIVSPLPYRLDLEVNFLDVVPERSIRAAVDGDLRGDASLRLVPHAGGSKITLIWDLEPAHAPMRLLVRIARPLIVRTKDWAIGIALRTFRHHIEV
jgi:hypothetical protein